MVVVVVSGMVSGSRIVSITDPSQAVVCREGRGQLAPRVQISQLLSLDLSTFGAKGSDQPIT